jgi:outer membrane protein OmpA-like peptidoglycan-associated protein
MKSVPLRHPAPARAWALGLMVGVACGLVGCGTPPPAPGASSGPGTARPSPRTDPQPFAGAPLKAERQWLQAWFRDTPVRVVEREGGAVAVEVPRAFCFEPGRSDPKPALAAVLDKVAESLRRVPSAQLVLIAAPDDGASPAAALAQERASRVQRHLRSRGVAASRLAKPGVTSAAAVQLHLEAAAAAP